MTTRKVKPPTVITTKPLRHLAPLLRLGALTVAADQIDLITQEGTYPDPTTGQPKYQPSQIMVRGTLLPNPLGRAQLQDFLAQLGRETLYWIPNDPPQRQGTGLKSEPPTPVSAADGPNDNLPAPEGVTDGVE